MIKHFFAITLAILVLQVSNVQAQIEIPRPSPGSSISQDLGLSKVEIKYSRPKMNGRKIFGEGSDYLVPFGEMWRTGANSGSTISFSDDVTIEGTSVPAGEYLILSVPAKIEWKVVLYKNTGIGGNTSKYKEDEVQASFMVKSSKLSEKVETMTFQITDISEDNSAANIQLSWENTAVSLGIKVDFDKKVMASIEKNTKVDPNNLASAARYYLETNRDLEQALVWINTYLESNPKAFWNIHIKAKILAKMGKKKEAIAAAKESKKMASANEGGDFGYIKRNDDLIKSL